MRKVFLFIFLQAGFVFCCSQSTQNIDSLKKIINSDASGAARDSAMFWASWYYLNVDLDSSFWYSQKAHAFAKEIGCRPIEGFSLVIMGDVFSYRANAPKAMELLYQALDLFEELKDSLGRATANHDLGNAFFNEKDTAKAFHHWKKALMLAPHTPIGNSVKSWTLTNLGIAYHRMNKDDVALNYALQAYQYTLKGSENKYLGGIYDLLAATQSSVNPKKAIDYSRAAVAEHLKNNNPNGVNDSYAFIASAFQKLKQEDSGFYYARKSFEIGLQLRVTGGLIKPGKVLVKLFSSHNRYDSAFKYQQLIESDKDSLFNKTKTGELQNIIFNEQMHQQEKIGEQQQYQNRLKIYVLASILSLVLIIVVILLRNNRQKQVINISLKKEKQKTEEAFEELKSTQAQLVQREKMASLGELTAGIAHEIQNPLNFVNNFSEVNIELSNELKDELAKIEIVAGDKTNLEEIAETIIKNEQKISYHSKRADGIVKGMLQHSRTNTGQKESVDINIMADEYLRLSYHGLRAKDKSFNATIKTDFDSRIGKISIIPQDIGRVLLNLYNNAFYSITEKKKQRGADGHIYEPIVDVSTKAVFSVPGVLRGVEIRVKDNGLGVPEKILDKIYQPFFTTKPAGNGTGLGLSLSYEIITKGHGGEIKIETKPGEYAEFIIQLPIYL